MTESYYSDLLGKEDDSGIIQGWDMDFVDADRLIVYSKEIDQTIVDDLDWLVENSYEMTTQGEHELFKYIKELFEDGCIRGSSTDIDMQIALEECESYDDLRKYEKLAAVRVGKYQQDYVKGTFSFEYYFDWDEEHPICFYIEDYKVTCAGGE